MFRKALQIIVTLAILIGAHLGYTRGFEVIIDRLAVAPDDQDQPFTHTRSSSEVRATELARELLPPGHWAAKPGLPINYYDTERGFYLLAENYKRLKGGKQVELWPVAVLSVSKDNKSHKVVTSNRAVVDLNQPFLSMKAGPGPMKILHAELSGDVVIRDDKGTGDGADDLIVGPLTHIEYDDKAAQITSDSPVLVRDRNLRTEGLGLVIQLRRRAGATAAGLSGFEAETVKLHRKVHIISQNVGSTNILPGKSKADGNGQVPLDLKCDGEMEITLPPSRPVAKVGPPAPALPTLARFQVNVLVVRGTHTPDQLNCDTLTLTLMPTPKDPAAATRQGGAVAGTAELVPADAPGSAPALASAQPGGPDPAGPDAEAPSSGPLTELKIREALAQGFAVWVQSESQGLKARCGELKYKKSAEPGVPDETYLNRGPRNNNLYVEKIERINEGPQRGAIRRVLRLYTVDATIFDDGQGGDSTIVSRGPGKAEERPALNASVERTAWWDDQLILRTEAGPVAPGVAVASAAAATPGAKPARGPLRRELTLTGVTKLMDHVRQNTLSAQKKMIIRFRSNPKPGAEASDGATEIESLHAYEGATLTGPNRTLVARDMLVAVFEAPDPAAPPPAPGRASAMTPVPAAPAAVPGPSIPLPANPALASARVARPAAGAANANPAPADGGDPNADPAAKPTPVAKVEPAVDVRANRVWAKIRPAGGEGGKDEFRDAQLRGNVMVHQDPAADKARGVDASGEALDLVSQGDGLMRFRVVAAEPEAAIAAKTRLVGAGRPLPTSILPPVLARVETQEMTIEGPDIGLDQKNDYAEVNGGGKLTEWTDRNLLDDKGAPAGKVRTISATANGKPVAPTPVALGGPPRARLVITWTEQMRFHGRTVDPQGRPAAKAEFRGLTADVRTPDGRLSTRHGVEARMEDSFIGCDSMDVFTDKVVALNKDARRPAARPKDGEAPAEPAAQIALMDCRGTDRNSGDQLMPGVDVIHEKYYLGTRDHVDRQRIYSEHVVYDRRTGEFTAPEEGLVFLYNREGGKKEKEKDKERDGLGPDALTVSAPGTRPAKLPPLKLTKVSFSQGMQGRFAAGRDKPDKGDQVAEFDGDVQVINGMVSDVYTDLDYDRIINDQMFLTSQYLRVIQAPMGDGKSAQQTMFARGNAQARTTDRTIQGDRITYDSTNELAYVYGDNGREVVLVDQRTNGQPATPLRGKSARYNRVTREANIVDPQTIYFADLKSGSRLKPMPPNLGGSGKRPNPVKPQRSKYYKTPRMHIERGGSTGR